MAAAAQDALDVDRAVLEGLQNKIEGRIVLPGYPDYDTDRQLTNPLFQSNPKVIVYCRGQGNDVVAALEAADRMGLPVTLRSGGHSTAGYSTGPGMIIDTRQMKSAAVSQAPPLSQNTVRVQPGCAFGELNDTLDLYRLHVPGGGCPDVCAAGYIQGGGFGFTSRPYDMNSDNVLAVEMVLANGTQVMADALTNPDLFWAVRGGTGGDFGVLTNITYGLHRLDYQPGTTNGQLYGYGLRWPLSTATERKVRRAGVLLDARQLHAWHLDTEHRVHDRCG